MLEVMEVGGIRHGREIYALGHKLSVVDEVKDPANEIDRRSAKQFMRAGWVRDLETGEQRPRDTSHKSLDVHS